jgi:RNA polymerase sigma-70 factor (ECF subfamily)
MPISDEEIARAVQGGDSERFGLLVERYEKRLLRYGTRFIRDGADIEDLVQDIFIRAYENIRSFDVKQRFSPWIYRIAHNTFVNGLRKHSRNPLSFIDFDTILPHPIYVDPVEDERNQAETKKMIATGLDKLAAKYREVLILYFLEEMSYREIAAILEIPTGTVGIRLKRAKKELKVVYEKLNIKYQQ